MCNHIIFPKIGYIQISKIPFGFYQQLYQFKGKHFWTGKQGDKFDFITVYCSLVVFILSIIIGPSSTLCICCVALGQRCSMGRSLTAVVCVVVGLVGFNIYLIRRLLLLVILHYRVVPWVNFISSSMFRRLYYFCHHLVLAAEYYSPIYHGSSSCNSVCFNFDTVLDGCLSHHVQGLRGYSTHRHRVIQVVACSIAAFLIVVMLLLLMVTADRLSGQGHEVGVIHTANIWSNTLGLLFLSHQVVFSTIFVKYELLYVRGVQLVALVFALNVEAGRGLDVHDIVSVEAIWWSWKATSYSFVHTYLAVLLLLLQTEVYIWNLFEVSNKCKGLWWHHFLIPWWELQPGISKDIFCAWTFIRVLVENSQQELTSLSRNVILKG